MPWRPPARLSLEEFAFLALDEDNLGRLPGFEAEAPAEAEFEYLTACVAEWLRRCSVGGDLVYVETAYWGGKGTQGAVRFQDGRCVYGPAHGGIGTINAALSGLGVSDTPPLDPFASIGPSSYRGNDDFRAASKR